VILLLVLQECDLITKKTDHLHALIYE